MVSRVSLQDIINADWSKQYLDNNGEVKNKSCRYDFLGIGQKLVKLLRYVPFISALFPKADITQASTAVKAKITELLKTGTSADNAEIVQAAQAALKVNGIVRKIFRTQDNPTIKMALFRALIHVNSLKPQPDGLFDNEDDIEEVQPTTPKQVHDKADDKEEEIVPTTPTNTQSTPVAETPAEPARVEIIPDDAEQTPVQEEPKAPTDEGLSLGLGKPVEGDIYDDISSIPLSLYPKALHFNIFEQNTPADELVAEEVAVPPQEVIAKEREDAKKDVAKDTQKASARTEGNKRKKQEEKAKAPVQAAKPKQAVAPKKGHANKKTKHN